MHGAIAASPPLPSFLSQLCSFQGINACVGACAVSRTQAIPRVSACLHHPQCATPPARTLRHPSLRPTVHASLAVCDVHACVLMHGDGCMYPCIHAPWRLQAHDGPLTPFRRASSSGLKQAGGVGDMGADIMAAAAAARKRLRGGMRASGSGGPIIPPQVRSPCTLYPKP